MIYNVQDMTLLIEQENQRIQAAFNNWVPPGSGEHGVAPQLELKKFTYQDTEKVYELTMSLQVPGKVDSYIWECTLRYEKMPDIFGLQQAFQLLWDQWEEDKLNVGIRLLYVVPRIVRLWPEKK